MPRASHPLRSPSREPPPGEGLEKELNDLPAPAPPRKPFPPTPGALQHGTPSPATVHLRFASPCASFPQGIFQELSQNGDSVVTVPEATALDMPIPYPSQPVQNPGQKMASDDEEVRLSGTPVHEPDDAFLMPPRRERRTSNVNLLTALDRRKGTLLECSLDVAPGDTLNQAREFLELVEKAAAGTLGVVHAFGVGKATVTWNLFRHHPLHQAQACACALQVVACAWPANVVSGTLFEGSPTARAPLTTLCCRPCCALDFGVRNVKSQVWEHAERGAGTCI